MRTLSLAALPVGRLLGVPIFIHWSFPALLAYVGWEAMTQGGLVDLVANVALVVVVFAIVTMHEYGHILTARLFGIGATRVTLLAIGGVAQLKAIPAKSGPEFCIALGGPAVNVALAAIAAATIAGVWGTDAIGLPLTDGGGIVLDGPLSYVQTLMLVNLLQLGFNLIPAFPMDGGRVLRATLNLMMPFPKATWAAVRIGQVVAVAMIAGALWLGAWVPAVIGLVVIGLAEVELRVMRRLLARAKAEREAIAKQRLVDAVVASGVATASGERPA